MLQSLSIQNYAIIQQLTLHPGNNLNIITGETGAGKSIMMGALGLILGERADTSVLMDKERKCIIEAEFLVSGNKRFQQIIKKTELDNESVCIVRREIALNGKSRAFINDSPVTLSVLNEVTASLVDMHQQFGHLALQEDAFQMEVLDAISDSGRLLENYQTLFREYRTITQELSKLETERQQFQKEADYKKFLYEELETAAFKENELEETASQLKQFSSTENILETLTTVQIALNEGEQPLINELRRALQQLQNLADVLPEIKTVTQRLNSVYEELKDIISDVESLKNNVVTNPEKIQQLQERLDTGYSLLKKHGFQNTNELIALRTQLLGELQSSLDTETQISELKKKQEKLHHDLLQKAQELSTKRRKAIPPFEKQLNEWIHLVGMPNAQLKISMQPLQTPSKFGMDTVQFLWDANKSGTFAPVYKTASGGEMSRMMLCIKSLIARALEMPTLVFDEVDTGISGEAAKQVGMLLKDLAKYHQVICITHLPQVAAKADHHFYVYKEQGKTDKVLAGIKELNEEQHIYAVAQMIGGEQPGEAALHNARELAG